MCCTKVLKMYFDNFLFSVSVISINGVEPNYANLNSPNSYKLFKYNSPLLLKYDNGKLPEFQIAYETWGQLNQTKSNAILLFSGLSANSHAKSHQVSQIYRLN